MLFHETRKQSTSLNDRQWEMLTHQSCGLIHICQNQPKRVKTVLLIWVVMKDKNCRHRGCTLFETWSLLTATCSHHAT